MRQTSFRPVTGRRHVPPGLRCPRGVIRVAGAAAAAWLLLAAAAPAFGQPGGAHAFEAGGGYAFLGGAGTVEGYGAGWFADGGWRATRWLTVAGEFGRHQRRQDLGFIDADTTVENLMAGIRILHRRPRFGPYAQFLVGAVRVKRTAYLSFPVDAAAGEATVYGALQVGGGIELPVSARLAVRIGADYRRVLDSAGLHHHRFVTGAVYGF